MPWQCTTASHSIHGCTALWFGSSPAMVLSLMVPTGDWEQLSERKRQHFFSSSFSCKDKLLSVLSSLGFLTNQQRAVHLLRVRNMKSFTTKIIPVQWSLQSSKAPLGPAPALESLVLRWDVVLQLGGVVSSDPSWDLFSQCPLCLLSLSWGWAHNEPALLWALPASCLKDCCQLDDLLTDFNPLCLSSLLFQGRVDLCQHLSLPQPVVHTLAWFLYWPQPAYECCQEHEQIRSSPPDWPSPESEDGAQSTGIDSTWPPLALVLASSCWLIKLQPKVVH